jgi:uridine kinase
MATEPNQGANMKIEQLLSNAEKIGVIGSPSSTSELSLDIIATAVTRKLVGELAMFGFYQDTYVHLAMGQITEIAMRNVWHEDPTMRSLIRQHGRVDAVSERQDTHLGKMIISAVFKTDGENYRPSILGTVPPTGTEIFLIKGDILKKILQAYQNQIFYLGNVYGSTPLMPLWFKHFDSGVNGAGEAYHLGVFGKTGSGKSVLTKMILLAYAKHRNMGIFILDPQGEFSQGIDNKPTDMRGIFSRDVLRSVGKKVIIYTLDQIRLDRWEIFLELLNESNFFDDMGIRAPKNQEIAQDILADKLKGQIKLEDLHREESYREALRILYNNSSSIYVQGEGEKRLKSTVSDLLKSDMKKSWISVANLFAQNDQNTKKTANRIIHSAFANQSRDIVIIDLSQSPENMSQTEWNDKIKPLLIKRFVSEIVSSADRSYKDKQTLNSLVVIDEAHRFVPSGRIENSTIDKIRQEIVDGVRTTRKYGLGWIFVSQTLSSLDNEIIQQLRVMFFGFGLSMGTEYQKLRELVGGQKESLSLYQLFRDPQSAFDAESKEYSFMTIGPVSPLSFSGTPLFLNAFNNIDDFLRSNGLID